MKTNIVLACDLKGISLGKLARSLDIAEAHMTKIAKGEVRPRIDIAQKIARALGLSTDKLFISDDNGNQNIEATKAS